MTALVLPAARDAFLAGQLGWLADDFDVVLCGADDAVGDAFSAYTNRSDFQDELASAPVAGRSMPGDGVAAAQDTPVPGVPVGQSVRAVMITESVTGMLVWGSTSHADGMPVNRVSDGNPIVVHWFNGSGHIFRI